MKPNPEPKFVVANGITIDIDSDKAQVLPKLRELLQIDLPDCDIVNKTTWHRKDRKFFFNNPYATMYSRKTFAGERLIAAESAARDNGMEIEEVEHDLGPYFRQVLVLNIVPGFRLKVSIDKIDRDPKTVCVMHGWARRFPPIPRHVTLKFLMDDALDKWRKALDKLEVEEEPNAQERRQHGDKNHRRRRQRKQGH